MKINVLIFYLVSICPLALAQVKVLEQAHAHNDYEHNHPLFDALSYGFNSVEADVHLIKGELYVSHATPVFNKARTLNQLYLNPLDSLIRINNGRVYRNNKPPFYLMIDIKTNGEETYQKFMEVLEPYKSLLTGENPPLVIFISGNRPVETIVQDKRQWVALDGRPSDLNKGYSKKLMPVVSIDFKSLSKWSGTGDIAVEELSNIKSLAQQVHQENKKLRLWGIPDQPHSWKTLLEAGVDLINTDKLKELSEFLNNQPTDR
ncbi:MAG TPA: phosphatidylinositol-specific phospholipase C/glycerophosphodiester phosphodiesterase family protein [Cyclobacteriaceae bacterium]|nr:phosphatidylinositol-specific phospholipase C/glycerophosphodiester phosphodiesterase family protein [Cyclobacteriaceae bacterium]